MRATTAVIVFAGLAIGGLVVVALAPAEDEPALGGGVSGPVTPGDAPLDTLVETSLHRAEEANAPRSVNPRSQPPRPEAPSDAKPAQIAIGESSNWQPPTHDLPQGVYHDLQNLLVVGPRWIYEWRAIENGHPTELLSEHTSERGLIPHASMGYLDGEHFVRWATGGGWLPNDIAGVQHARRRTRLYRKGRDLCVDAECHRRLRFSALSRAKSQTLRSYLSANVSVYTHRIGRVFLSTRVRPSLTEAEGVTAYFAVSWVDAQNVTHAWGTEKKIPSLEETSDPLKIQHFQHSLAARPETVATRREGWPEVEPEDVRCVCTDGECTHDDRFVSVIAVVELETTGLPFHAQGWRCDRPDAVRRWPLDPVGLTGEAQLQLGEMKWARLWLPPLQRAATAGVVRPHELTLHDPQGVTMWRFIAYTDGSLGVTRPVLGVPTTTTLRPKGAPVEIR